jgi:hypothetical protein
MTPFVWSVMGHDAGQPLGEIVLRKEAERKIGGNFWWGLGTPLGSRVESVAISNGKMLSSLFSAALAQKKTGQVSNQVVRVWNGWRSILTGQRGTIPKHALVLGGSLDRPYYALVCRCDHPIRLGDHGRFDPAQCLTVANGIAPGSSQRAALLTSRLPHSTGPYRISFKAELIGPWFVRLTDDRPLTAADLAKVLGFKPGDDWLGLCSTIRH